jgi:broad specificity phosphatase PhoE
MTILIFIRHGETAWSRSKEFRFRGRVDIPLTDHGILQARATGRRLQNEKIAQVYASPLKRAKDTASEIARMHNLQVLDHPGFIDLNFGTWQGELHEKLKIEQGELYDQWLSSPGTMVFPKGEALVNVRERIESACSDLVTKHPNDTIVIVTHGAVLRVILCFLKGIGNEHYWDFFMDNCALLIAKFENGYYSILAENDNEHLLELGS